MASRAISLCFIAFCSFLLIQSARAGPCDQSPCLNGGECSEYVLRGVTEYHCLCPEGFYGFDCEGEFLNTNNCASNPCQNGGECTDYLWFGYTCTCLSGYYGTHCETQEVGPE
ncbi:protein delta homolog 2-like [Diadema antillarum]|uniref:protein delta homolog 2-like n=1 Tax=Diadema antillarum TaxID=105358 RepID=UPI003A8774F6